MTIDQHTSQPAHLADLLLQQKHNGAALKERSPQRKLIPATTNKCGVLNVEAVEPMKQSGETDLICCATVELNLSEESGGNLAAKPAVSTRGKRRIECTCARPAGWDRCCRPRCAPSWDARLACLAAASKQVAQKPPEHSKGQDAVP